MGFLRSFVYAGRGIWFCIRHERNFRIHMVAAAYVPVSYTHLRGILEYEEGVIRLNTTSGIVRFMGRDLTMNCLTEDSAVVTGFILSVEFLS